MFLQQGAAAVGSALASARKPVVKGGGGERTLFAVIADSHVIDGFYKPGSENGVEDNESILLANGRLAAARDTINAIRMLDERRVEQVFW